MRRLPALLPLALIAALVPGTAAAAEPGVHSDNMSYVKNLPYAPKNGGTTSFGSDIEFAKVAGRQYAFAGSYRNGMQIVDITNPQNATIAAVYDCGVTQGDVQIFRQRSKPGRLFVGYASDTWGDGTSTCYWNIDDLRPTSSATDSCTAHVFDIHEREQIMTIAYYNGGVHVVDISGLTGVSLGDSTMVGGPGMRELGYYRTENGDGAGFADSWSFKTPKVTRTGDFYAYGNDIARGLDVYKFSNARGASQRTGRWMSPTQAEALAASRPKVALSSDTAFFCLLPQD